jgi:hypothetical protein
MGFVRLAYMERFGVGFRINGDGPQSQALCRTDNAASDLAAIGNEHR